MRVASLLFRQFLTLAASVQSQQAALRCLVGPSCHALKCHSTWQLRQHWPSQLHLHRHRHGRQSICTTVTAASGSATKLKQDFKCKECGKVFGQWTGKCLGCGGWNTIEKFIYAPETATTASGGGGGARAARAATGSKGGASEGAGWGSRGGQASISGKPAAAFRTGAWVQGSNRPQSLTDVSKGGYGDAWRLPLRGPGGAELGRVLGGGVVPGSMVLIGGDPGVGKSTLLLQVASMLADISSADVVVPGTEVNGVDDMTGDLEQEQGTVLYVSGEESIQQIGSRAARMGLAVNDNIYLYSATRLQDVLAEILSMRPRAVIVDSIQTVYLDDVNGSAGSVSQVRECATALLHVAKPHDIPIFLVGHVTKSGDIAGPKVLEHIVDVVLYMEGEKHQSFRLIRGMKNRYGAIEEVGVFSMNEKGLEAVPNPSALFLTNRDSSPGVSSAVTVQMEGSRPLLLEVQALCSPVQGKEGMPMRFPTGVSRDRFNLITAVLAKHARLKMHAVSIHTNVVGGMIMTEPANDLAIAVAIASSYYEQPIARDIACIGEIGLGGELREVGRIEQRMAEAAKLGFTTFVIPASHAKPTFSRLTDVRIIRCRHIMEALKAVLGTGKSVASMTELGTGSAPQDPFDNDDSDF
ncbi:TPA: hypothetical protein ACH3X3_006374 [Trebouxia sp. C0006]